MPVYVGLLRGVNVGGKRRVPMAELRALLETLGFTEVRSYIQSGNVIFLNRTRPVTERIEAAIADAFGVNTTVMLRTPTAIAQVLKANPFPNADVSKLHVGFMTERPSPGRVAGIDAERFLPDQFVVLGTELFVHLPNGMARTKLLVYLDRQLKVPTTVRNWNTVTHLVDLAHS